MYLNVTDLTTYNVAYESYCIRWTAHRAATSYRLKLNPIDRKFFTQHYKRLVHVDFDIC